MDTHVVNNEHYNNLDDKDDHVEPREPLVFVVHGVDSQLEHDCMQVIES